MFLIIIEQLIMHSWIRNIEMKNKNSFTNWQRRLSAIRNSNHCIDRKTNHDLLLCATNLVVAILFGVRSHLKSLYISLNPYCSFDTLHVVNDVVYGSIYVQINNCWCNQFSVFENSVFFLRTTHFEFNLYIPNFEETFYMFNVQCLDNNRLFEYLPCAKRICNLAKHQPKSRPLHWESTISLCTSSFRFKHFPHTLRCVQIISITMR